MLKNSCECVVSFDDYYGVENCFQFSSVQKPFYQRQYQIGGNLGRHLLDGVIL